MESVSDRRERETLGKRISQRVKKPEKGDARKEGSGKSAIDEK